MSSLESLVDTGAKRTGVHDIQARQVGIWKQYTSNEGVYYERDKDQYGAWSLWANVHRLYPKKNKKRIVLLGESVARAYFYDPFYTVAGELQAVLNKAAGTSTYEVIDLARTSMNIHIAKDLVRSCGALDPDAVTIFAGNNWYLDFYNALDPEDYAAFYSVFREQSFAGLKQMIEHRFRQFVVSFLDEVQVHLTDHKIPVVFIIPGYNLKDWKSDTLGKNLSWLPGDGVERWLEARKQAEAALACNNPEKLRFAAEQMVQIDPSNPYGFELLSQYFIATAQWEQAKKYLEAGRDAMLIRKGGNNFPACFGILSEIIISEAAERKITVLDLPAVFNEIRKEGIPDRDLYLDYCHLTVKGIKLCMRHAARLLMQAITGREVSPAAVMASSLEPANNVKAFAHLSAAIHSAHKGQPAEILQFHCRKAISYSTEVKDQMLFLADFSTRHTPSVLCRTFQQIVAQGKMRQYDGGVGLRHPPDSKVMDILLVNAMVAALRTAGVKMDDDIESLRQQEHGIGGEQVDLLSSFYSNESYNYLPFEGRRPIFLQVRSTEYSFCFITDAKHDLEFTIAYRTPGTQAENKRILVAVNGKQLIEPQLPTSQTWTRQSFIIPVNDLKAGVNKLTLLWPYTGLPFREVEHCTSAARLLNVISPAIGEIHSFKAIKKA